MIRKIINSTTVPVIIMLVLAIILLCIGGCNNVTGDGPFDYQRIWISGDDVVVSVLNDDADRPLAVYYFAEQQGKKHNAFLVGVDHSISVKIKSFGWTWGKTQEREEYTYHYRFYYKKRGIKK